MTDPVIPEVPPEPDNLLPPPNPDALAKKNKELLGELKKVKERYKVLETAATAAGVDPADPAGFIARRDAEARAKADREGRVRDAVKDHLLEGGHRLDRKLVSVLITGATADSNVTIDGDGNPSGISEYVEGWLSSLKGAAPNADPGLPPTGTKVSSSPPPPGRPGREAERPKGPSSFTELTNQGPAAVKAFREQNPARYAELHQAHLQGLRSPTRPMPQ